MKSSQRWFVADLVDFGRVELLPLHQRLCRESAQEDAHVRKLVLNDLDVVRVVGVDVR